MSDKQGFHLNKNGKAFCGFHKESHFRSFNKLSLFFLRGLLAARFLNRRILHFQPQIDLAEFVPGCSSIQVCSGWFERGIYVQRRVIEFLSLQPVMLDFKQHANKVTCLRLDGTAAMTLHLEWRQSTCPEIPD